jgi:hypothetical protein
VRDRSPRAILLPAAIALLLGCGDGRDALPVDAAQDAAAAARDASTAADAGRTPQHDASLSEDDAGGDHDAGASPTPTSEFYPLTDAARWVYRHSGGGSDWDEAVELRATQYLGRAALLLSDTPGPSGTRSESVLVLEAGRVLRIHRDELAGDALQLTTDYDPGFLRFDHAWAARDPGHVETLGYTRVERDAQGQVTADGERSHRYTVESLSDTVEVPAGSFSDCLRVRRSRIRAATSPAVEGDEDLFWFCAGIGKVREEDQVSGEREELVSCVVPDGACP